MTAERTVRAGRCFTVYCPQFDDTITGSLRMNRFYNHMSDAVFAYFTEITSNTHGVNCTCDFSIKQDKDLIEVSVLLRLRRRGKTMYARVLTHTWKDGMIVNKTVLQTPDMLSTTRVKTLRKKKA